MHVAKGKPLANATKLWLTELGQCIVANNNSRIPERDLREIKTIISINYPFIESKWKKHFPSFELKFYYKGNNRENDAR